MLPGRLTAPRQEKGIEVTTLAYKSDFGRREDAEELDIYYETSEPYRQILFRSKSDLILTPNRGVRSEPTLRILRRLRQYVWV